jgi:hypothetical protein
MRTLIHHSAPFDIGLTNKVCEKPIGRENSPTVVFKCHEWLIKVVEQNLASFELAEKNLA